jgi:uridine phosphorylase
MFAKDNLILNQDGSVYHLGLNPKQIADRIIFVGDPERVPKVSRHFDTIEDKVQRREFITHTGYIGKVRISVISTGMGTDNIDIVMNELDLLHNVDFENRTYKLHQKPLLILRLGTTGALHDSIEIGDFVLSRFAIGMDNLGHYYTRPDDAQIQKYLEQWLTENNIHTPFIPYFTQTHHVFAEHILKTIPCKAGITMTNPGFYAPQNRFLRSHVYPLSSFVNKVTEFAYQKNVVLNMEMETSGILALSNYMGWVSASLSVVLAHRKKSIFSENAEHDITRLIEAGISVITEYNIT